MPDSNPPASTVPIIDLHSHFPMHLAWAEGNGDSHANFLKQVSALGEAEKHALVVLDGLLFGKCDPHPAKWRGQRADRRPNPVGSDGPALTSCSRARRR